MMLQDQLTQIVKHSIAYGYAFSQPFVFYVDAYPLMQKELLEQAEMLKFGMQHESVKTLQHKLQRLSYYDSSIDGNFGVLTEYALKKFQEDYLLENQGKVDKATVEEIFEKESAIFRTILNDYDNDFSLGETGNDVKELQEALFYFGYYLAEIDGIFGEKSKRALTEFQQDQGNKAYHVNAEVNNTPNETPQIKAITETELAEDSQNKSNTKQALNEKDAQSKADVSPTESSQIVSVAKKFIGIPYRWGGTTTNGFDCSGYLQHVFNQLDVSLPRTVSDMWNATKSVKQPSVGDLVFFETYKPGPSHAGIYIGDGNFIHAGESNGVSISKLNTNYWNKRYLGAKRVNLQ